MQAFKQEQRRVLSDPKWLDQVKPEIEAIVNSHIIKVMANAVKRRGDEQSAGIVLASAVMLGVCIGEKLHQEDWMILPPWAKQP